MNRIQEIDKEISNLKAERAELLKYEKDTPDDIKLAELLHSKQCHWNHTDGCSWYYENWDNPDYTKQKYLDKARKILLEMKYEDVLKCINILK